MLFVITLQPRVGALATDLPYQFAYLSYFESNGHCPAIFKASKLTSTPETGTNLTFLIRFFSSAFTTSFVTMEQPPYPLRQKSFPFCKFIVDTSPLAITSVLEKRYSGMRR
jgi:hypothetical protein